jgi:hypothetical protein
MPCPPHQNGFEDRALLVGESLLKVGRQTEVLRYELAPSSGSMGVAHRCRDHHARLVADGSAYYCVRLDRSIGEYSRLRATVVSALQKRLTDQQIAELQAIYYLGRDGWFSEHYEDYVETTRKQHALENDAPKQILHLMLKANFLQATIRGLPRLGRPSLATQLSEI